MGGGPGRAGRAAVPALDALRVPEEYGAVAGGGAWGRAGHPQGTHLQQKPSADVGESRADMKPNTSWPKGMDSCPLALFFPPFQAVPFIYSPT